MGRVSKAATSLWATYDFLRSPNNQPNPSSALRHCAGLGGLCLFLLLRVLRRSEPTQRSDAPAPPPQDASQEIKLISEMMRSYIRESRNYSNYLSSANEQLAKPLEQLELMSVVECLIDENRNLLNSSCNLHIRLKESRNRIDALTHDLDAVREESQQDALTQLYGRRYFDLQLPKSIA